MSFIFQGGLGGDGVEDIPAEPGQLPCEVWGRQVPGSYHCTVVSGPWMLDLAALCM